MSIWCSHPHIGTDPTYWQDEHGRPLPKVAERGNVLSFPDGFSNHYPDLTGSHERPAVVALATVPEWCVPGHGDEVGDALGPWLRLEVVATETVNFWREGDPVEVREATVLLDEQAVRALYHDLGDWLKTPKAHPIEEDA